MSWYKPWSWGSGKLTEGDGSKSGENYEAPSVKIWEDPLGYAGEKLNPKKRSNIGPVNRDNFNLPGYQSQYNRYGQLADKWGQSRAPIANTNYAAGSSPYAARQSDFGNQLLAEAQGRGVGQNVVRMQAQGAADNAARQQLSQAAAAPSSMQAAGMRNAAFNTGNIQSQVGGQAALAGGQMQLGAMNQYGGFLQGARGQDDAMGQFNASQRARQSEFGTSARMDQERMNRQSMLEAYQARLQAAQLQQQGGMSYENQLSNRYGIDMGVPSGGEKAVATAGQFGAWLFGNE